jgi:hypothetical protein
MVSSLAVRALNPAKTTCFQRAGGNVLLHGLGHLAEREALIPLVAREEILRQFGIEGGELAYEVEVAFLEVGGRGSIGVPTGDALHGMEVVEDGRGIQQVEVYLVDVG